MSVKWWKYVAMFKNIVLELQFKEECYVSFLLSLLNSKHHHTLSLFCLFVFFLKNEAVSVYVDILVKKKKKKKKKETPHLKSCIIIIEAYEFRFCLNFIVFHNLTYRNVACNKQLRVYERFSG